MCIRDSYNSSHRNVVADISWLIEKLFKEKNRILVCCKDLETVEVIDAFLWAYKQEEFIPHSIATKEKNSIYPGNNGVTGLMNI